MHHRGRRTRALALAVGRRETLEAFVLDRERWVVLGTWSGDKKVRIEPFDAVELDLAALWSR